MEGYGWVLAQDLWVGAKISRAHTGNGMLTAISVALRPQRMYNLSVARAHTFFVGQGQWLVHNDCFQLSSAGQHIPVDINTPRGLLAQEAKESIRQSSTRSNTKYYDLFWCLG